MIVRISRGRFSPDRAEAVTALMAQSEAALRGALESMPGLVHYYVGTDAIAGAVVNVSVWVTSAHAHGMDTLAPMLAQRPILVAAGVEFEPITNHEVQWEVGT